MPLVYETLRRIAVRQLREDRAADSLDPTELVHLLYLQLVNQRQAMWQNRGQFFALVAQMMRRILVDQARARLADKRGGASIHVTLDALADEASRDRRPMADVLAVDRALERLTARDSHLAKIVVLRFFGGLSIEETAHVLDCSPATVKRSWRLARAWLFRDLSIR